MPAELLIDDAERWIALVLGVAGALVVVSCLLSGVGRRLGVPVSLLFLAIGMLAGSDGPGGIWFDRFDVSYAAGTAALVLILYAGGLHTPIAAVRAVLGPAALLATVGVALVAALTAGAVAVTGYSWTAALLVGSIVASTDAAAVFGVLEGIHLRRKVGLTIELESGLNDPMAVLLTTVMAEAFIEGQPVSVWLGVDVLAQLVIGVLGGLLFGLLGRELLRRVRLAPAALYPVLSVGIAALAYGATTEAGGSGFLAVYLAGMAVGNGNVPYATTMERVHDALAWLGQVAMFLLLGLLVFPSRLPPVADEGIALALFLAFVARPIAVTLCLLPFGFRWREIACIGWVGLRGAVPIILAMVPVLSAVSHSQWREDVLQMFDVVFFMVVVGSIVPGATVRRVVRALGLEEEQPPAPMAEVDITSSVPAQQRPLDIFIRANSPAEGRLLAEVPLPHAASIMLIVRGSELIAPRGDTRIEAGDHVFALTPAAFAAEVRRAFGAGEAAE